MTIDLSHQTAVVVGAARGIGKAITEAFLDAGACVIAVDLDEEALAGMSADFRDRLTPRQADITDYEAMRKLAEEFPEGVDHIVCSAAIGSGKFGFPFWNLDPADWKRVVDVTLMGTIHTVQAFTPALLQGETQRKTVLLLSSVAGQIGSQTDPPYSACKAAIINFAQCAAKDFAPHGIRVNALSPGMVKTELNRSVWQSSKESDTTSYENWARDKISRIAPLGRWQEPEEFGAMAVFLASEAAKNITGQTINIDGGQVMHS